MKKVISLLLVVMMAVSLTAVSVSAATGNVRISADKAEYEATDTTISISIKSLAKTVSVDGFYVTFDPTKVEFVEIQKPDGTAIAEPKNLFLEFDYDGDLEKQRFAEAKKNAETPEVAFGFSNTSDVTYVESDPFAIIKFKIIEGTSGDVKFTLNETSGGTGGYTGVADTVTVKVKGADPTPTVSTATTPSDAKAKRSWTVTLPMTAMSKTLKAQLINTTKSDATTEEVTLEFEDDLKDVDWSGTGNATITVWTELKNAANVDDVLKLKFSVGTASATN